jgi:hypothetical protein
MTEQTKEQVKSSNGEQPRKRVPLGTRNVLTAPKKPGFVRRFVNDVGDRIQMFKDASWNVSADVNQVGDDKIGKASLIGSMANPSVGQGKRAILMEIPEEIYNADRAASQAKITKVENEIKRNSKKPDKDGLEGEIKIS